MNNLLKRWRSYRNRMMLDTPYKAGYAFVGAGSHALQNLYPAIQYLGIGLKYICCRHSSRMPLIERRFGVTATTSIDTILNDDKIKGVFVCTSPDSHYDICSQLIKSGKQVFVEKPPCLNSEELEALIADDTDRRIMVGMQKRYSPLVRSLKKKIASDTPSNYTIVYHTGSYPEGNPVTDLFIHPVDLAIFLFGPADLKGCQIVERKGSCTVQMLLSHSSINGSLELSTDYSWISPEETLRINAGKGEYLLFNMEKLCFRKHHMKIAGIPLEKTGLFTASEEIISMRDSFSPVVTNNQLYSQGFLS
ncbi:MAG: Gfo/Idh/MocA family oxidoreductase, partial [Muribaculaceae bacterium]|nr:Gfo/Idh/MocA family oxidoreductase [Muribaculaceae bacterium]